MINPEQDRARKILEHTDTNLFLTGKAGTGKTTFLRRFRNETAKRMVVLAPTGIAAINAGGSTIHSFFQLPFAPYIPGTNYSKEAFRMSRQKVKLIRSLDLIVIDEISMVRADLLDSIDNVLRRYRDRFRPFGGIQLLMIGDLQQLAPVVSDADWALLKGHYTTPFFFGSHALAASSYVSIELQHVYRQSDPEFIDLLGHVREGSADADTLKRLNSRYLKDFTPRREDGYIRLVTHNRQAAEINSYELGLITSRTFTYKAEVVGSFPESSFPTDECLHLKLGAQIMFVKNDRDQEKRYFNGMLGEIIDIDEDGFTVRPIGENAGCDRIRVEPDEWTNARYALNEETKEVEEVIEGTFRQFPVRAAWAITIHKSQGLTFERAIVDAHSAFAHGQTYVALSRLKSLEGLVLSSPIPPAAIITDATVSGFNSAMADSAPNEATLSRLEATYFQRMACDLFTFTEIGGGAKTLGRILDEYLYRQYPKAGQLWQAACLIFEQKVEAISPRFAAQLEHLVTTTSDYATDPHIADRIKRGCAYFRPEVSALLEALKGLNLPIDNKTVKKRFTDQRTTLLEVLAVKVKLLRYIQDSGFSVERYQRAKTNLVVFGSIDGKGSKVDKESADRPSVRESSEPQKKVKASTTDIENPELFEALTSWRYATATAKGVPACHILRQTALIGIVNLAPADSKALLLVSGVGSKTVELYGEEILAIVAQHRAG